MNIKVSKEEIWEQFLKGKTKEEAYELKAQEYLNEGYAESIPEAYDMAKIDIESFITAVYKVKNNLNETQLET